MRLQRIDEAIEACNRHLEGLPSPAAEIESYLTQYLTIIIHVCFEAEIRNVVTKRAERSPDNELKAFLISGLHLLRGIKTGDIAEFLVRLGPDYSEEFKMQMKVSSEAEQAETFYNNLVVGRHLAAHQAQTSMTFGDLIQFYEKGHVVLDTLSAVLLRTA